MFGALAWLVSFSAVSPNLFLSSPLLCLGPWLGLCYSLLSLRISFSLHFCVWGLGLACVILCCLSESLSLSTSHLSCCCVWCYECMMMCGRPCDLMVQREKKVDMWMEFNRSDRHNLHFPYLSFALFGSKTTHYSCGFASYCNG